MPSQDELIKMLLAGALGPWAGQGFVPGGITILRPDTMQWETIVADAQDADLMHSTLGDPVDPSTTWEEATEEDKLLVEGLTTSMGIAPTVGGGSFGHVMASVVPASQYVIADFVRTELGQIRLTEGISNGSSGPLSPIRNGAARNVVDKDGVPWLPVVRMNGVDAERRDGMRGPGGVW